MSPTSYQAAPPRKSNITAELRSVKLRSNERTIQRWKSASFNPAKVMHHSPMNRTHADFSTLPNMLINFNRELVGGRRQSDSALQSKSWGRIGRNFAAIKFKQLHSVSRRPTALRPGWPAGSAPRRMLLQNLSGIFPGPLPATCAGHWPAARYR